MSGEHAFLAPSDYEGWSRCPGKPSLAEHFPDKSGEYADWGTDAHGHTTSWIRTGAPPVIADPAMQDAVECAVQAHQDAMHGHMLQGAQVQVYLDRKVPVGIITGEEGARGTLDLARVATYVDGRVVLEVVDWKFGIGVPVPVENNGQLQLYALAFILEHHLWLFTDVSLIIHQPRIDRRPQLWQTTVDALHAFGAAATQHAAKALALRNSAEALVNLVPGDKQCRFCRAVGSCKARADQATQVALAQIPHLEGPGSVGVLMEGKRLAMSREELAQHYAEQLPKLDLLMAWCKAIDEGAYELAVTQGVPIPGYKVVDGRAGNRRFTDPDMVYELVKRMGYTDTQLKTEPVLLTPPAMEKALPPKVHAKLWALLKGDDKAAPPQAGFIVQSKAAPALVPVSDPRPPRVQQADTAAVLTEIPNLETIPP
jgi:Protein of unknown function (DUF2800)